MQRATVLQLHYVVDHPKVGEGLIKKKLPMCNTFKDKSYLLILEAINQLCKELQALSGGSKFARNRSISYGFRDKRHSPFPPKFKMAAEIWKSQYFSDVLDE